MLNRVILIGRLTRDGELRYTPAGVAVYTCTLAVDRPFSGQGGKREADFIPVVCWRALAETCANYLRKGRLESGGKTAAGDSSPEHDPFTNDGIPVDVSNADLPF